MAIGSENGLFLDFGDQHILGQARLDQLDHLGMHGIGDFRRPADEFNFEVAFDDALPVHQPGGVVE